MVRARKKHSSRSPTADPVVHLANDLLALWDADDASQQEFLDMGERVSEIVRDEALQQFSDWRDAVETVVSFTQAKGLEGALVQMVLAVDTLDDVLPVLSQHDRESGAKGLKIDRLLR